jgi:hypothetical protein
MQSVEEMTLATIHETHDWNRMSGRFARTGDLSMPMNGDHPFVE